MRVEQKRSIPAESPNEHGLEQVLLHIGQRDADDARLGSLQREHEHGHVGLRDGADDVNASQCDGARPFGKESDTGRAHDLDILDENVPGSPNQDAHATCGVNDHTPESGGQAGFGLHDQRGARSVRANACFARIGRNEGGSRGQDHRSVFPVGQDLYL